MKRIVMQAFLLCAYITAFGQQDSITIKGTLKGQGNLKVVISLVNAEGKKECYQVAATQKYLWRIAR